MNSDRFSFLRSDHWDELGSVITDQRRNIPPPPIQKPVPKDASKIPLIPSQELDVGAMALIDAIRKRRSERTYASKPLTLEELSFLLWATQGLSGTIHRGNVSLRTVPSAGARHPFETYLLLQRVEEIEVGLFRYLPIEHALCLLDKNEDLPERIHEAAFRQYVLDSAITFMWSAIPYRTEWRYASVSPKLIALDAGHLCQNLYLASVSIDAGACAIGAYDQDKIDKVLDLDGKNELTVYMATVGKLR